MRIDDGGYLVIVAAFDGNLPDIPRIKGRGVAPDIAVDACRTYCNGRDPQWERLAELIATDR